MDHGLDSQVGTFNQEGNPYQNMDLLLQE